FRGGRRGLPRSATFLRQSASDVARGRSPQKLANGRPSTTLRTPAVRHATASEHRAPHRRVAGSSWSSGLPWPPHQYYRLLKRPIVGLTVRELSLEREVEHPAGKWRGREVLRCRGRKSNNGNVSCETEWIATMATRQ